MSSIGPFPADAVLAPALAVALALVHLFAGRLGVGGRIPRSRWLSLAGGVSVAYVFVHLLPEVGAAATTLAARGTATGESVGYLIALLGFVAFYGLEQFARRSDSDPEADADGTETAVFWIHVGSFAVYNAIVGALLLDRELGGSVPFVVAMALHFLVTDDGLRDHHGATYRHRGRWVLSAAILAGVVVGDALEDTELLASVFVPFLAGGIVLNAIKEELPSDRESRFPAFALGAAGYAALLLFA